MRDKLFLEINKNYERKNQYIKEQLNKEEYPICFVDYESLDVNLLMEGRTTNIGKIEPFVFLETEFSNRVKYDFLDNECGIGGGKAYITEIIDDKYILDFTEDAITFDGENTFVFFPSHFLEEYSEKELNGKVSLYLNSEGEAPIIAYINEDEEVLVGSISVGTLGICLSNEKVKTLLEEKEIPVQIVLSEIYFSKFTVI